MGSESGKWAGFAEDYDRKVFSLTRFPDRRKQLLEKISEGQVLNRGPCSAPYLNAGLMVNREKVLNMGAGSAPYLNVDLVAAGNYVVASDFCEGMLDVAKRNFSHPSLEYVLADSACLPFESGSFDSVVSVNSILPPKRREVDLMFWEAFRVLKPFGFFVAFLCSYDSAERYSRMLGSSMLFDKAQLRLNDTSGWQCFHTPVSIGEEIVDAGFRSYMYEKVELDTPAEVAEMKRLYGIDTSSLPIYEYLLTARKL